MGKKKEKKEETKKEDDDEEIPCSTTRRSERLAAKAAVAVAAAAPKVAASVAACVAMFPTEALPPVILDGRFQGYMSPDYVEQLSMNWNLTYISMLKENFEDWQDRTAEELPMQFARRHNMLNEIRSTRTDDPSFRMPAADAAAAAAAPKAAAAAATPAAGPPTATARALPDIVTKGRFKGYMSPDYVEATKEVTKYEHHKWYRSQAQEAFAYWQDQVTDRLPVQFMHRHNMLEEIRSMRTDAPSEAVTTAAAAAAAADDTSVAAAAAATAAAAAATNAAAAIIARLEHELGEMVAAAAAATAATAAATNAAATAAAEEIARLQHELDEMTHWLRTVSTPQVFYPAPRDPREVDEWVAWCNSTP